MRLKKVEHGQSWLRRLLWKLLPLLGRPGPFDMGRLVGYRTTYFGRPFGKLFSDVLSQPTAWSLGERALLAAFVSQQNRCHY
jgi:hypothetical protein